MRVSKEIIESEGERLTPHSKFYIWKKKLFEPVIIKGKKAKTYKTVDDRWRIADIEARQKRICESPLVSEEAISLCYKKASKKKKIKNRFELLDL